MPGTIFFRDTRNPQGIDHVSQRCLIFNKNDTAQNSGAFHLAATLPDGERFFLPAGDLLNDQDPLRPFTIPNDVDAPVQCVVNVDPPDGWGADNRRTCSVFLVPDGGTLQFDGANYSVIPPSVPTDTPRKGCAGMVLMACLAAATGLALLTLTV